MINDALNQIAAAYGSVPTVTGAQSVYLPAYAFAADEETAFGSFYNEAGDELLLHPWKGKTLAAASIAFFGQYVHSFTIASGGLGQIFPSKDPTSVIPQVLSITSSEDGETISVEFDLPLSEVGLDPDNFLVQINNEVPEEASAVEVNSEDDFILDITPTTPILFGDTARLYALMAVSGLYGALASIDGEVDNDVDDTPPAFVSASSNSAGTLIILTFDADMADPSDHVSDFSAEVGGTGVTVSAADLGSNIKTIELTLAEAIVFGDVVTVSMDAGNVKNSLGVQAEALTDESVTNIVPE
jgi:uncharacterized repeat protein (TIGR02059 family)